MALELPIDSTDPHYVLTVQLEGARYQLAMDWNERESAWYLSVAEEDGTQIVDGIRVVVDWPLLRKVAASTRPPGEIVFVDTSRSGEDPGRYELGERVVATYFLESEL